MNDLENMDTKLGELGMRVNSNICKVTLMVHTEQEDAVTTGMVQLQYILRTSPTFLCQDELVRFDEKVRDGLQANLNVDLQEGNWTQASLSVRAGGISVRKSRYLSVPAYISFSLSTEMLVDAVLHKTGIPASARISLREVAQQEWVIFVSITRYLGTVS